MNIRLTNYYIGIQIAYILIGWLANAATGVYINNIWTQLQLIESIILLTNSFLVYRMLYASKGHIPQILLYFSLSLTALVFIGQSISVIWNGFVIYQVPFHLIFLFGFAYSLYLIAALLKGAFKRPSNL